MPDPEEGTIAYDRGFCSGPQGCKALPLSQPYHWVSLIEVAITMTALLKSRLVIILFFTLAVFPANAAEYYVATDGNDANPGTLSQPWLTFKNAVSSQVQPGDTVFVRGGVYSTYPSGFYNDSGQEAILPIFRFAGVNGTAANPVTYKSYPGETAIIDPLGSTVGVMIQGKTGIVIEGFEIRNSRVKGIWTQDNSSDLQILNNRIYDTRGPAGSNVGGIVLNSGDDVLIEGNVLHGNYLDLTNPNGANIFLFSGTKNINIRNNELYDSQTGIFYKHSGAGPSVFENNYIHDIRSRGFRIASDNVTMKNNLLVDVGLAFDIHLEAGCSECSRDNVIENNTSVDSGGYLLNRGGALPGAINTVVRDNVFYETSDDIQNPIWRYGSDADLLANTPNLQASNNNYSTPSSLSFGYFDAIGSWGDLGETYSLPDFQALGPGFEQGSFNADPLFVDAAAGDFRLRPDSLSFGADSNGDGNIGADICSVAGQAGLCQVADGDFDQNGDINGADFLLWQRDMNVGSLSDWEAGFGATSAASAAVGVPEPTTMALGILAAISLLAKRRRSHSLRERHES